MVYILVKPFSPGVLTVTTSGAREETETIASFWERERIGTGGPRERMRERAGIQAFIKKLELTQFRPMRPV